MKEGVLIRIIFNKIYSLGCSVEPLHIHNKNKFGEPIAVYHYLGSFERYMSRGDVRRGKKTYDNSNRKAIFAKGDGNNSSSSSNINDDDDDDDGNNYRWWIGGWLDSFVETHGTEKVLTVLGDNYYSTIKQ